MATEDTPAWVLEAGDDDEFTERLEQLSRKPTSGNEHYKNIMARIQTLSASLSERARRAMDR